VASSDAGAEFDADVDAIIGGGLRERLDYCNALPLPQQPITHIVTVPVMALAALRIRHVTDPV